MDLSTAFTQALATTAGVQADDATAKPNAAVLTLVRAVAAHRQLFTGAPHFPQALAVALSEVDGCDLTWSFKTTGAGGEDALLLVGLEADLRAPAAVLKTLGWRRLRAGFESAGARVSRGGRHG